MRHARKRTFVRLLPVAVMLAAPAVLAQARSVREGVLALADAMQHRGALGVALYVFVYILAATLLTPKWILGALAGFAYGRVVGVAVALPACVLGATAASLTGRMLSHTRWGRALLDHPRVAQVNLVVRHDGRRIATLLRLSPLMPQNLLDYALGATPLRVRDLMLSALVGLFPATCVQVYVGSLVRHASELFDTRRGGHPVTDIHTWGPAALGLMITAVALVVVMRIARRALTEALAKAEAGGKSASDQPF